MKKNIKVGVNCFFLNKSRGMAKYAKRLIDNIPYEKILFFPDGEECEFLDEKVVSKGPKFYALWEQYYLPKLVEQYKCTHLISPFNTQPIFLSNGIKRICVIHDLIFLKNILSCFRNKFSYFLPSLYCSINFLMLLKSSTFYITVSKYSASNLSYFITKKRLLVIPNSLDKEWWDINFSLKKELYFFTVSGTTPNKNLMKLLKAFRIYVKKGGINNLEIAGIKKNAKYKIEKIIKKNKLDKHVQICGKMTNKQMIMKYRKCSAFISTSTEEGFGIPILEAMATKTPILCGNTSSFPEVTKNNAIFFDPFDYLSIAEAMISKINLCNDSIIEKAYKSSLEYHPDNLKSYFKSFLEIF